MDVKRINELYKEVLERIENNHIGCFEGMDTPLFLISTQYPGIWMEHLYDSVIYAKMFPERTEIAVNTVKEYQKEHEIEVIFNVFKDYDYELYRELLSAD